MLTVNSCLTVMQLVCGFVANSLSLVGDGALMGMDSVSYAVGLYAERRKAEAVQAERADRLGALFSSVMLAATTIWLLFDVVDRLFNDDKDVVRVPDSLGANDATQASDGGGVEVDGGIMIGFTSVNLIADAAVLLACWRCGGAALLMDSTEAEGQSHENMNFFSALAHLAADVVRGVAVMVCGVLAVVGVVEPAKADAYCSLFVCIFVLVAVGSLLRVLLRKSAPEVYEHMEDDRDESARHKDEAGPQPATLGATAV